VSNSIPYRITVRDKLQKETM